MQRYQNNCIGVITKPNISQFNVQGYPQVRVQQPQRQSQASSINLSHLHNASQRISNVSSNKMSVATRPDLLISQCKTPSQLSRKSNASLSLSTPRKLSKKILIQNLMPTPNKNVKKEATSLQQQQKQVPLISNYSNNLTTSNKVSKYINKQTNPYQQAQHKTQNINILVNRQYSLLQPSSRSIEIKPITTSNDNSIKKNIKVQQTVNRNINQDEILGGVQKQSRIQIRTNLVGQYSIQNHQLPPRLIVMPKIVQRSRLYKSAVFQKNGGRNRSTSRARSTASFRRKPKKQVLIRRNHRSFISNKKIPVIGSIVGNDKSKYSVVRQMLPPSNRPKVLAANIIATQLIQVIPTQIIKIPINQDDSDFQSQNSFLEDQAFSTTSNPILDQQTLIKKYPEQKISDQQQVKSCFDLKDSKSQSRSYFSSMSNRSVRLSDHIKISVYRSPSVVIKKPQIITSGPKLSKQHVMRIATEGKVISSIKQYKLSKNNPSDSGSQNSQKARYGTININNILNISNSFNPYKQTQTLLKPSTIQLINLKLNSLPTLPPQSTLSNNPILKQTTIIKQQNTQQSICQDNSDILSVKNLKNKVPKISKALQQKMKALRLKNQMKKQQLQQSWKKSRIE